MPQKEQKPEIEIKMTLHKPKKTLFHYDSEDEDMIIYDVDEKLMDAHIRMTGSSGMERISSAPRLSFSNQDVFNLRNHNLSQLSRSTPGIYSPQRKGLDLSLQQINLIAGTRTPPKSILIKPKEEPVPEKVSEDEKEEKISFYKLRLELQFTAFVFLCFILAIVIPLSMIIVVPYTRSGQLFGLEGRFAASLGYQSLPPTDLGRVNEEMASPGGRPLQGIQQP
ncbi:uncharacterized protein TNCV_2970701 [Trichonephila clavipes]|nr:uncharacterized protein TNCV_2970701 [Trichonephila clavipes]